jgi:hypothetical protein
MGTLNSTLRLWDYVAGKWRAPSMRLRLRLRCRVPAPCAYRAAPPRA